MQFTRKIVLSLLIIVLCSAMAFASEESPVPEQAPLEVDDAPFTWVDEDLAQIMKTAQDIKALTATTYDTTDIYNLLYAALVGRSASSSYALVSMNSDIRNMYQDLSGFLSPSVGFSPLQSLQYLPSIASILGVTSPNQTSFVNSILDSLYFSAGGDNYSQAELTGMIWSLVNSLDSKSTVSNSYLSNIDSSNRLNFTKLASLEGNLQAFNTDFNNLNWSTVSSTPLNFYKSIDSSVVTGQVVSPVGNDNDSYYFAYSSSGFYGSASGYVLDFNVPFYTTSSAHDLEFRGVFYNASTPLKYSNSYIYLDDHSVHFIVFLLEPIPTSSNIHVVFRINQGSWRLSSDSSGSISSASIRRIDFDTFDYHILNLSLSNSQSSDYLKSLAEYLVNPAKKAAEQASQEVVNETLDDFTGSGSAAAKASDSRSMKNVSGSIQSGLDSGGSVSGATGVFNSGSDFWGWFTQQNANYINNPYPAPVVSPTRGSGDEIVDFLTPNSNELQDLLRQGGDER